MKHLWVKYLSLLLILAQTSVLFADTLTFNNGYKVEGEVIRIDEKSSDLGNSTEIFFRLNKSLIDEIPAIAVINQIDEYTVILKDEFISEIVDNDGVTIFSNGKYLINNKTNLAKLDKDLKAVGKGAVEGAVGYALGTLIGFAIGGVVLLFLLLIDWPTATS